jgi:ketosteroid isomerase-like protein
MKTKGIVFCLAFLLVGFTQAQDKADVEAIHKLIDEYGKTEDAGDMTAQAKLMTADRTWIGPQGRGRMTNQAMNMEFQQAQLDEMKKMVPGLRWFMDARDRIVKFYGNGKVAVASFYWYRMAVIPGDTPLEIQEVINSFTLPGVITLVLTKEGNNWKIAHTHSSSLLPPPAED